MALIFGLKQGLNPPEHGRKLDIFSNIVTMAINLR
jgi:hypothetical protein